jgi:hypothetical protein
MKFPTALSQEQRNEADDDKSYTGCIRCHGGRRGFLWKRENLTYRAWING